MTSFDFAVLITSTWLNQCVQYLRLTSGPKRKNEYNNFCFLRRVEVLEKNVFTGPGPCLDPGVVVVVLLLVLLLLYLLLL